MTPDRTALRARIESFDIDGPEPAALPFAARLARENGWSRPYAERVITEYRRFVYLTAAAGFPVCPSEDVDAAWHLHLTYTRSYWQRLCGEVLGRPLHHDPTRGGPAEAEKHLTMYARTLAAYREAFGHEPPVDVWPPPAVRFGDDLRHRVVNTARNWVIPKRPIKQVVGAAAAFLLLAVFTPGCAGGLNPFDLVGAQFLAFLIPVMIAAVWLGRVIRSARRGPGPQPGDENLELSWEDAAFLAGGYPRLTTAATAQLVASKAAELGPGKEELRKGPTASAARLSPVEAAVFGALPVQNTRTALRPVQEAVEAKYGARAAQLEADGLVLPKSRMFGVGCAAVLPLLLVVLVFGVPRLLMGLANHKPVGYLVATLLIGGVVGLPMAAAGTLRLTRRGDALLAAFRNRHARLMSGGTENVGLAVALFGTAALVGTEIAYLQTWYPRQTAGSGGCGSGCGTSSGCGGGGDGGGGGGCGGGCGGCGGGGGD